MKKLVGVAALALFIAVPAYGGIATFGDVQNDVLAGTDAILNVTIAVETLAAFDGVDCIVGWHEAGDLTFEYHPDFIAATMIQLPPAYDEHAYYMNDAKLGGTQFGAPISDTTPILMGTVTLETDGLAVGNYIVEINYAEDGNYSKLGLAGVTEELNGSGYVRVVPEPASLMLLGLGAAVGLRRRRA